MPVTGHDNNPFVHLCDHSTVKCLSLRILWSRLPSASSGGRLPPVGECQKALHRRSTRGPTPRRRVRVHLMAARYRLVHIGSRTKYRTILFGRDRMCNFERHGDDLPGLDSRVSEMRFGSCQRKKGLAWWPSDYGSPHPGRSSHPVVIVSASRNGGTAHRI